MGLEVSIIVPSYNEERFLPGLLGSIRQHGPTEAEVIVVDNGSTDNTAAVAAAHGARLIRLDQKVFPSWARNAGAEQAKGRILIFFDADVELAPEWEREWNTIRAELLAKPLQITGDRCHISKQPSWIERIWFAPMRDKVPAYINGANLITTRAAFDAIGGFDGQLETGEDVDFCRRAQRSGISIRVNDGFKVYHEGYPKTAARFMRRERWHGVGDFRSVGSVIRSKVALATLGFIALHVLFVLSLLVALAGGRSVSFLLIAAAAIVALCVAGCVQKFPNAGASMVVRAVPLMYIYYIGRALSLWDVTRKRLMPARAGAHHR